MGTEAPPLLDVEGARAEMGDKLPGMLGAWTRRTPGMNTTDTIDFEMVLEGTIVLELDDGAVICGASHAKVPSG